MTLTKQERYCTSASPPDYDSDTDPPCLPDSGSDSEDDVPAAKARRQGAPQARPGAWGRRGALVVEDGGGDTFRQMAQAFQADRDVKGLNKKKSNNVWGSVVQEESIADSIGSFGVGRQLKDLGSDRGAETYDFTLVAKARREERERLRREGEAGREAGLDTEMDNYWSRREERSKSRSRSRSAEREEEMQEGKEMQQTKEVKESEEMQEEGQARGTKRSVKDRLGKRADGGLAKVPIDRFKQEKLAAPGAPTQVVDIAEISLVEGTDQDFGEEVAERLREEKEEMIVDLVKVVGRRVVWEFFQETQKVEREGGMVINNGARRRTPGGVMLHLLRKTERPELKDKLRKFFNDSQKEDRRKILAAKKRKEKNFDKEMAEFLTARKQLKEAKAEDGAMEEDGEAAPDGDEAAELAPLPNVLSMIASSMATAAAEEPKKASVTRVSSFKEPEAPPNSVERAERLSPVSREERDLLDYDEDDFLGTAGDTEDIELF